MTSQSLPASTGSPADDLAELAAVLDRLADRPTWSVRDGELIAGVETLLAMSARVDAIRVAWVRAADQRGSIAATGAPSTNAWLRGHLRIAPGTAGAQVRLGERLLLERCAQTAKAFARGTINTAQAEVIARTLASLPDQLTPEALAEGERSLLDYATRLDARALQQVAQHLRAVLDPEYPDALARTEFERVECRTFTLTDLSDGWTLLRGQLDPEGASTLRAALEPLCAPAPSGELGFDPRSAAHRRGDGLVELASRQLKGGQLPRHGGVRPTLVVTMDYDQLVKNLGTGEVLGTGQRLSPAAVRKLACDAKVIPMVLGGRSEILDVGRAAYRASAAQRIALAVRDRGCVNPTCHAPPQWCDVHHIVPFAKGGKTNFDSLALFCARDHTKVHSGELLATPQPRMPPLVTWIRPRFRRLL